MMWEIGESDNSMKCIKVGAITWTVLCLIIFFVSIARAQEPKRHPQYDIGCKEWSLLPFATQESETKELESIGIDGIEVQVKSHMLSEEQILFFERCDPQEQSKPVMEEAQMGRRGGVVREFKTYEVNGRIIAYRFTCYVVMAKDGYVTERAGAAGDIYYISEDGGGSFDRYQGAMPLRFLPVWVKAMASANTRQ